ncbi:MAG: ankyrin repeat domain-containing protein [Chlamydiales bacterium]
MSNIENTYRFWRYQDQIGQFHQNPSAYLLTNKLGEAGGVIKRSWRLITWIKLKYYGASLDRDKVAERINTIFQNFCPTNELLRDGRWVNSTISTLRVLGHQYKLDHLIKQLRFQWVLPISEHDVDLVKDPKNHGFNCAVSQYVLRYGLGADFEDCPNECLSAIKEIMEMGCILHPTEDSPLVEAILIGNVSAFKVLFKQIKDRCNEWHGLRSKGNPLTVLALSKSTEILPNYIVKNSILYPKIYSQLEQKSEESSYRILVKLIEHGFDPLAANNKGSQALHFAAQLKYPSCVELLLQQPGIDINSKSMGAEGNTALGNTALHFALDFVEIDHLFYNLDDAKNTDKIVKLLLDKGAHHLSNQEGMWPIHLAAKHGYENSCRLLLEKFPEFSNQRSREGKLPIEYAIHCNSSIIVEQLFKLTKISDDEYSRFLILATTHQGLIRNPHIFKYLLKFIGNFEIDIERLLMRIMEKDEEIEVWVLVKMVLETQKVTEKSIKAVIGQAKQKGFDDFLFILLEDKNFLQMHYPIEYRSPIQVQQDRRIMRYDSLIDRNRNTFEPKLRNIVGSVLSSYLNFQDRIKFLCLSKNTNKDYGGMIGVVTIEYVKKFFPIGGLSLGNGELNIELSSIEKKTVANQVIEVMLNNSLQVQQQLKPCSLFERFITACEDHKLINKQEISRNASDKTNLEAIQQLKNKLNEPSMTQKALRILKTHFLVIKILAKNNRYAFCDVLLNAKAHRDKLIKKHRDKFFREEQNSNLEKEQNPINLIEDSIICMKDQYLSVPFIQDIFNQFNPCTLNSNSKDDILTPGIGVSFKDRQDEYLLHIQGMIDRRNVRPYLFPTEDSPLVEAILIGNVSAFKVLFKQIKDRCNEWHELRSKGNPLTVLALSKSTKILVKHSISFPNIYSQLEQKSEESSYRILAKLIKHGFDPLAANDQGSQALHFAAQLKYPSCVELLLGQRDIDINRSTAGVKGNTALHFALDFVEIDHLFYNLDDAKNTDKIVKLLLDKGAHHLSNQEGMWPIHFAAKHGYENSCRLLLEKFPESKNQRSREGKLPIEYAFIEGHKTIFEQLSNQNKKDLIESLSQMPRAVKYKQDPIAISRKKIRKTLEEKITNILPAYISPDKYIDDCMEILSRDPEADYDNVIGMVIIRNVKEFFPIAGELLGNQKIELESSSIKARTIGNQLVQAILDHPLIGDHVDQAGKHPFDQLIQVCIDQKLINAQEVPRDKNGKIDLETTARWLKNKLNEPSRLEKALRIITVYSLFIRDLMDFLHASYLERDKNEKTLLEKTFFLTANLISKNTLDGDTKNYIEKNMNRSFLKRTTGNFSLRSQDEYSLYIKAMMDIGNVVSPIETSPFVLTIFMGNVGAFEVLLKEIKKRGLQVIEKKLVNPLTVLALAKDENFLSDYVGGNLYLYENVLSDMAKKSEESSYRILVKLIEHGFDPLAANDQGSQALHFAAQLKYPSCVELLLQQPGIDINSKSMGAEGNTALHFALQILKPNSPFYNVDDRENTDKIVKLLLDKDAHHLPNQEGMWPIHLAAKHGYENSCRLLLEKFPESKNQESEEGTLPIEYAISNSKIAVVKELFDLMTIDDDRYLGLLILSVTQKRSIANLHIFKYLLGFIDCFEIDVEQLLIQIMENGGENKIWVFVKMVLDTQKVMEPSIMEAIVDRATKNGFNHLLIDVIRESAIWEKVLKNSHENVPNAYQLKV